MKTPEVLEENRETNAEAAGDCFLLAGKTWNAMARERIIHKGGQP
jgi:hypothetical protein